LDPDLLRQAFKLSAKLRPSYHYSVQLGLRQVLLTAEGKRRIRFAFASHSSLLSVPAIHQHLVVQALVARETLRPGRDYLVEDGKVLVIDEATGRQMPDRQWSDGLHQMVELSEGLKVTTMRVTTASISFQRFFPRYLHLCGMTGTARTAARELWRVYNLRVRQIAPRAGDARHWEPVRVFATSEARWEAVAHHAAKLSARGIPVLIGTRSVTASEACSRALTAEKLSHNLLNANSTAYEAAIIAEAGQVGRITVATNMAGRGTDIKLSNEARALGGLTVILTEMHDDRRIDLQLYGRCGRQGEKGQVLNILSLEDELMKTAPSFLQRIAAVAINLRNEHLAFLIMLLQQKLRSGMQSRVRNRLRANDRRRQQALGIAGMEE
jgi:preprotein translocase subunit SecA